MVAVVALTVHVARSAYLAPFREVDAQRRALDRQARDLRLGYATDRADDRDAAIEAVSCQPYDLVCMDLVLPGTGGVEATP